MVFFRLLGFCIGLSFFLFLGRVSYAASTYNLSSSSNYNIRVRSTNTSQGFNIRPMQTAADFDADGKNDLVISMFSGGNAGVYLIPGTVLESVAKGGDLDVDDSTKYRIKYTVGGALPTRTVVLTGDIDGDGRKDLIFSDGDASGSVFIILGSRLSAYTGTGNNLDLTTDTSAWNFRIDYTGSDTTFGAYGMVSDLDGNGKDDLLISNAHNNSPCTACGALYIFRDSIFSGYTGTGNVLSLADSSSYSIRYEMSVSSGSPNLSAGFTVKDINGNSVPDIVVSALDYDPSSRTNAGSVFVVYDSLLSSITGTGNVKQIDSASNHNIQFIGSTAGYHFGGSFVDAGDLNRDGTTDLAVGSYGANFNGVSGISGSVYIIPSSVFSSLSGTGNTVDMATSTNWWIRIDGPAGGADYQALGNSGMVADVDGDANPDLVVQDATTDYNSLTNSGSVYYFNSSLLQSYSGTGNTIDLSTSDSFSLRFDGSVSSESLGGNGSFVGFSHGNSLLDLNNDGKKDFLLGTGLYRLFIFYNFPHTISVSSLTNPENSYEVTVAGTVSASNSVTSIAAVQYSIDTSSYSASWSSCTAADGSFNSASESFTCSFSNTAKTSHTAYLRAYDSNSSYSSSSQLASKGFTISFPFSSSFSGTGQKSCDSPKPGGDVILYQIDTEKNSAALQFAPTNDHTTYYYFVYGFKEGAEQFGTTLYTGSSMLPITYTIGNLASNTTYFFRVRPGNGCMPGDWSNWMSAKTTSAGIKKRFYFYK